ncbi:hypothetical protein IU448_01020 [Nocardia flavorosea]|uniref:hypothetical protein n=1 Tax=Nocardia flavorosea TaxID=53429 RepID=UPI0018931EBD|nr:hypothetical protein [Nocardia flavorosea]MBF6347594.1 hypothetical protein [Nocardia flavorosea]
MPGQHRKPARARKLAPLAGSTVAATAVIALSVMARPAPTPQATAVAADTQASPATGTGAASETPPMPPQPAEAVAAVDAPREPARYLKRHAPPPPMIPCSTELAGTQPHVAQVGNLIGQTFGVADIGGANGRYDGEHGAGLALDFMTSDPAHGDAIADFVLANKERFGVSYVIWQQQYNDGSGWSYMEDRGSPTQNHYDHVHVSFYSGADVQVTC